MCWKQEWAAAIGSIQRALNHIDVAQHKLQRRYEKNLTALANRSGRNWDKFEAKKVLERMYKNQEGIAQCKILKGLLQERQEQLYQMIVSYGISKGKENKRIIKLMYGYRIRDEE